MWGWWAERTNRSRNLGKREKERREKIKRVGHQWPGTSQTASHGEEKQDI